MTGGFLPTICMRRNDWFDHRKKGGGQGWPMMNNLRQYWADHDTNVPQNLRRKVGEVSRDQGSVRYRQGRCNENDVIGIGGPHIEHRRDD